MTLTDIDPNLKPSVLDGQNYVFREAWQYPFSLEGLPFFAQDGKFCRLPQKALSLFNDNLSYLSWHTAGVLVRFRTDSSRIALTCQYPMPIHMGNMPPAGHSGFDLYVGRGHAADYVNTLIPSETMKDVSGVLLNGSGRMRDILINFPLYNGVDKVCIGLAPEARLEPPAPHAVEKPVLFYGSSITQGGCATHPGNGYFHIIGRNLDVPIVNFGFSGNAKGELEMADIIRSLDLSLLVMDYDHNAPNAAYLRETHEPFFQRIRAFRPKLPIMVLSKPDWRWGEDEEGRLRRDVIMTTYLHARQAGDDNVYFMDGEMFFHGPEATGCTVDGCHPNDLGFLRMAMHIEPVVRKALRLD